MIAAMAIGMQVGAVIGFVVGMCLDHWVWSWDLSPQSAFVRLWLLVMVVSGAGLGVGALVS